MKLCSSSSASSSERVAVTSIEPICATIIAVRGLCAERLKYEPTRFFRSFALPT
jgi:hypothetical protein